MRESNRNYIVVGIFVLSMLAALLVWIAMLTGRTGATDSYFILWDKVLGLKPGTQVFFEGYQVGVIDSIRLNERFVEDGSKHFRVDISVKRGWPIPTSAVAETTTASSFLSALVVNIEAGEADQLLTAGAEIQGQEPADILALVSETAAGVNRLAMETLKPALENISEQMTTTIDQVSRILSAENAEQIEQILANLTAVSKDVSSVMSGLKQTKGRVDHVLTTVDKLLTEHEGDVSQSLVDLQSTLETVSRHIDAIANNLEGTTRNMNEFSGQIRDNPGVLIRGRDTGDDAAAAGGS